MKNLSFPILILILLLSSNSFAQKNELGLKEGLPSDFPSDVPQPNNSKCVGHLPTSDGTSVSFVSSDSASEIIDFYKKEMKKAGFKLGDDGESLINETGGLISWNKEKRNILLLISYIKENNKSEIVITYK